MSEFLPPVVAVLAANLTGFSAGMQKAKAEMAEVEGSSAKMSAGISRAGKTSALAVLGIAGYSTHLAANFEQATNVLKTAAGETDAGLKIVRDGIKQVALQTGVSFGQLESGSYVLEKAGFRGAQTVEMLRVASQGAREENAQLGTVLNAMTSVMASYHLKTADSVRVMNALKTGAGEAKTSMEDYAGALSTVLPIASAANISFADVAGAFATLTQHGTSAQESTQELAATIRALQAPNHVQQQAMQQLGLSVLDVTSNLGRRGLTGTLDLLSKTIMQHMGPSGLVLLNAFNQSKTAAQDANIMIGTLPRNVQTLALAFRDGQVSTGDWRKALKGLPVDQANLLRQFASLENRARGFSDQIRSGGPAAQTYTALLKAVTGGAIGLNTALQLTGENMAMTKTRVQAVAKSYSDASRNVEGWETTQKNANTAMGEARNALDLIAMDLGNVLIPAVRSASGFIAHHTGLVKALAEVFGVILVGAVSVWVGKLVWSTTMTTVNLAKQVAGWLGLRSTVTASSAAGAAAVERAAVAEDAALAGVARQARFTQLAMWDLAGAEAKSSAAGTAAIVRNAGAAEAAMASEAAMATSVRSRILGALSLGGAVAGLAMTAQGSIPDMRIRQTSGDDAYNAVKGLKPGKDKKAFNKAFLRAFGLSTDKHGNTHWQVKDQGSLALFLAQFGAGSDSAMKLLSSLNATSQAKQMADLQRRASSDNPHIAVPAERQLAALRKRMQQATGAHGSALPPGLAAILRQSEGGNVAAGEHGSRLSGGGGGTSAGHHRARTSHAATTAARAAHQRATTNHARALEIMGLRENESGVAALIRQGRRTEHRTHRLLPPAELEHLRKVAEALLRRAKQDEVRFRGTRQHTEALNLLHKAIKDKAAALALGKLTPQELAAVQAATLRDKTDSSDCEGAENHMHVYLDGHEIYRNVQTRALRADQFNVNNGLSR